MSDGERISIARAEVKKALAAEGWPAGDMEVVGSTYISGRIDSDVDVLCWSPAFDICAMSFSGWAYGGSAGLCPDNDNWMSWKKAVNGVTVNMLITDKSDYAHKWLNAAEVCRYLHLRGYPIKTCDVHGIHEIIMDGSMAEDEIKRRG